MPPLELESIKLDKIPPVIFTIMLTLYKKGYDVFLVGGAVRDMFLNRSGGGLNYDLATSAPPEVTQSLFAHSFYNNPFGMVGVPVWATKTNQLTLTRLKDKPAAVVEITTFRSETGYSDRRRPDQVRWGKTIEADVSRRDFTINALALGIRAKQKGVTLANIKTKLEFVDLFNGLDDLKQGLIRAIGDPNKRFQEDALRLLRAVRFAVELGFRIETQTAQAIKSQAGLLKHISAERIRDEFFKILVTDKVDYGLNLLADSNLLEVFLPELLPAKQVILSKHHKYDLWDHLLLTAKHCPDTDPITRLAALIHDVGKIDTWAINCTKCGHIFKVDYQKPAFDCPKCGYQNNPRQAGIFYHHEMASAKLAKKLAKRLRLDNKSADKLYRLVRWHQFVVSEQLSDKAIKRFIRRVGVDQVPAMLALRVGDRLGSGVKKAISWRMEKFINRLTQVQKQPFSIKDLKVDGHDVMRLLKIKPSPQVGRILQTLFDQVEAGQLPNQREALIAAIKRMGDLHAKSS